MPDTKELERTLYEIAVAGAFYGLGSLSEVILNHLEDGGAANASAVLQGQALVKIAGGEPEAAVRMIDEAEDGAGPEAQVLKALALKRGGQAAAQRRDPRRPRRRPPARGARHGRGRAGRLRPVPPAAAAAPGPCGLCASRGPCGPSRLCARVQAGGA